MVDVAMVSRVGDTLPRMSRDVCSGLPQVQMVGGEDLVHQVWKAAIDGLLPGLVYTGHKRCNPYEEFAEITRPHKPRRSFDLSQSDVYMMKYMFTFEGKEIKPRYILLPYISNGTLINLKGTRYEVTPVIGGRVLNIERGMLYLPIARAKLKFSRISVGFVLNGKVVNEDAVHSSLYNMSAKDRPTTLVALLTHYILAEFGLSEMLKRFHGVDVKLGGKELDSLNTSGEWYVFKSKRIPITKTQGLDTIFTELRIAVPSAQYTQELNAVIGGVFYIADVRPEAINIDDVDNPRLWISILPTFLFKVNTLDQNRFDEMINHLSWLKGYVDSLTIKQLAKDGIIVKDVFQLFSYIITHMNDILAHHDVGTMFHQELSTVKHIYYNITHNIFSLMYDLKRISLDRLTADKIVSIMNDVMRTDRIYAITKHGEVNPCSMASDCKVFVTTCKCISQHKAANSDMGSGHQTLESDPAKMLHASQAQVCNLTMMGKGDPTGRSSINPFVFMRGRSYIAPRPDDADGVERLNSLLKGEFFLNK